MMNKTVDELRKIYNTVIEVGLDYGLDLLEAVVILVVGWWLAGRLRRGVRRALKRYPAMDEPLKPLVSNLVRYAVLIFTIVAVLAQFGVQTASIIAVLGAAGLAIGLALQGTLQNIAAGIMLLFLRPFKVGDFVEAAGHAGTVRELGLFTCEFRTGDGLFIFVPNADIWGSAIKNFSRNDTRRSDLIVGISYDDDIGAAIKVLEGLIVADERILDDPAPAIDVVALADSSVNLRARYWTAAGDFAAVQLALNRAAKEGLEAAGCNLPYPQRDVHLIGAKTPL